MPFGASQFLAEPLDHVTLREPVAVAGARRSPPQHIDQAVGMPAALMELLLDALIAEAHFADVLGLVQSRCEHGWMVHGLVARQTNADAELVSAGVGFRRRADEQHHWHFALPGQPGQSLTAFTFV